MLRESEIHRKLSTELTFPPRKTWYHTEVPPKSMWKSVKQPFTLIRQYLQHRSGGTGVQCSHRRWATLQSCLTWCPFINADAGKFPFLLLKFKSTWEFPQGDAPVIR